jgi:hypothetical protein
MPNHHKMSKRDPRPHLTKLTLGGFQVFDQVTDIPLGEITFLFGPNSAGKSSVRDGLELLSDLYAGDDWDRAKLNRHWRRSESGEFSKVMMIGFTTTTYVDYRAVLSHCSGRPDFSDEPALNPQWNGDDISSLFEFSLRDGELQPSDDRPRYTMGINGRSVLRIVPFERIGVNFGHPEVRGVGMKHDFRALAQQVTFFEVDGDWVYFRSAFAGMAGTVVTKRETLVQGAAMLSGVDRRASR